MADRYAERTEPTHYCEDCEVELTLMYDEREDKSVPIVCGHCGGTNTRELEAPA